MIDDMHIILGAQHRVATALINIEGDRDRAQMSLAHVAGVPEVRQPQQHVIYLL